MQGVEPLAAALYADGAQRVSRRSLDVLDRLLRQISDPVARKILIVQWGMRGDVLPTEAEILIAWHGLEAA